MSVLSDPQNALYQAQLAATAQCQNYFYKNGEAGFDSVNHMAETRPTALNEILNIVGFDSAADVDNAIKVGLSQYQYCHGGDLPHASVLATALDAGLCMAKKVSGYTGTHKQNLEQLESGFDDVSNTHHESVSIVPAMTVATIATLIAFASPIIAYIPNSNGSNEVPIVAARFTTDRAFGAMAKGEYLDGVNASKPYSEGRFRFVLDNGGAGTTYSTTARTKYANYADKTPDVNAPLLPFIGGNISIRINGKEVAHTRNRSKSKLAGQISAIAEKSAKIAGNEYSVAASTINLDDSTISVTFNQVLPNDVKAEVFLVADYEAKDVNNKFKLDPVGISISPEYETMVSSPIVTQIRASKLLVNQITNELNIGFVGTALSLMQGKIYLEQTVRLLGEGKERAQYNDREFI
jgi:phenylpyruvate tautomerase PptA (4-oxalocrotonate tautomerase family)